MNKKLIVCLVVFILAIGLIAICYDIKIKVDVEPHTIKPSTVSFLIIGGKSDELIKQKILENPLLLNTDFRVEIIPNIITNARWLEYE